MNKVGFTLMEVMITIVVMAVLASIAVPSYQKSVERSRSNEAKIGLNLIHTAQKIKRLDTGSYAGPAVGSSAVGQLLNIELPQEHYTFNLTMVDTNRYQAEAIRLTDDQCKLLISQGVENFKDGKISVTNCPF